MGTCFLSFFLFVTGGSPSSSASSMGLSFFLFVTGGSAFSSASSMGSCSFFLFFSLSQGLLLLQPLQWVLALFSFFLCRRVCFWLPFLFFFAVFLLRRLLSLHFVASLIRCSTTSLVSTVFAFSFCMCKPSQCYGFPFPSTLRASAPLSEKWHQTMVGWGCLARFPLGSLSLKTQ